jgi:hypothetical protein
MKLSAVKLGLHKGSCDKTLGFTRQDPPSWFQIGEIETTHWQDIGRGSKDA